MLNALYADLLATGRSGGLEGLSPKTVKEVHTIVHKALHDAVRWGRLGRNPTDLADPPAARSPEMQVLHDVRHSYASAALAAGVPAKVVSERLGHANIATTLDTYSHVLPALQEDAAEKIAALILETH